MRATEGASGAGRTEVIAITRAAPAAALVVFAVIGGLMAVAGAAARDHRAGKHVLGSTRADRLHGGLGADRISGGRGADRIWGNAGPDRIAGGRGADRVLGGSGNDRIAGGSGADRIYGESGRDRISGGLGGDRLSGGRGADRILARDGARDTVDCGRGRDVAYADRDDRTRHCESVRLHGASRPPTPAASAPAGGTPFDPPADPARRPNILLIVTDDQRFDTVTPEFMPNVSHELVDKGLSFSRAYVTRALCCPSRASILTGQYAHNHGVKTNTFKGNGDPDLNGGMKAFKDKSTLATWLHDAGYRTGLVGKYLNGYGWDGEGTAPGQDRYVPPGWDSFVTFIGLDRYYDYKLNVDGASIEGHPCPSYREIPPRPGGCDPADYSTNVLARHAAEFVREPGDRPFFLTFTPFAPHMPADPAPGDESKFGDFNHRPASFNEEDLTDKPKWLRDKHKERLSDREIREIDDFRLRQVRSLVAADRAVGRIIEELRLSGKLDNTLILFTSDNGYLWGEHRHVGKVVAYQESVRAPLIVKGPGVRHGSTGQIAANIDLAPTIAEAAQAQPTLTVDGRSLSPLFVNDPEAWRRDLLVEHWLGKRGDQVPSYVALVEERHKYVEYADPGNVPELYDLVEDPLELENRAGDDGRQDRVEQMSARVHELATCAGAGCL